MTTDEFDRKLGEIQRQHLELSQSFQYYSKENAESHEELLRRLTKLERLEVYLKKAGFVLIMSVLISGNVPTWLLDAIKAAL